MRPKPPPPTSLLLPGQQWTIVPSVNWVLVEGAHQCYFAMGDKQPCGAPALVHAARQSDFSRDGLCEDHMGTFQWVTDTGELLQWRADPPFENRPINTYVRKRHGTF